MDTDKGPEGSASPPARDEADGGRFGKIFDRYSALIAPLGSSVRIAVFIATALVAAVLLMWALDKAVLLYTTKSYVDELAVVLDLNKYLARAIIIASFVAAVFFGRYIWSFSKRRRLVGIAGISALLIGHSLALWYGTRGAFFDRAGVATKCYVLTRDGKVTYGERAGIDPTTGRLCRPLTAEMLERLQQYEQGKRPNLTSELDPVFFDPRTGEPIVWYSRSQSGEIQLFDLMGFHPETGEELIPVTRQIVEQWKALTADAKKRVPKPIDPANFVFFDPRNGSARAWYWVSRDGQYEFFDNPGFHPRTGESLAVVTREVLDVWKKASSKQAAPKRVDPNSYTFFDPATGAPKVWYWRGEGGSYEFYDAPGFHPRTGDKLEIITKDVVSKWKQEIDRPKKTDAPINQPRVDSTPSLEAKARSFLFAYMDISGAENSRALAFVLQAFAPSVDYFGKRMTKQQVFEDKRAFMTRWPERNYRLKPESIRINCIATDVYCDLSAEFDFRALNPRLGKLSSGVAINRLRLLFSSGDPQISSEDGSVISRTQNDVRMEPSAQLGNSNYTEPSAPQQQGMTPQQIQQAIDRLLGLVK